MVSIYKSIKSRTYGEVKLLDMWLFTRGGSFWDLAIYSKGLDLRAQTIHKGPVKPHICYNRPMEEILENKDHPENDGRSNVYDRSEF